MSQDRFQLDLCSGPVFRRVIQFAIPLILTNVLQILFHTTDLVVVGQFSTHESLAAIGCTGSLFNLFMNMVIGISIGANVLSARYFGAKDPENIRKTLHTSVAFAALGGIGLSIVTFFAAEPLLKLMDTPPEILPKSCLYLRITFLALPFLMLYNFGCSIFRAAGDTKRPFLFLAAGGTVNVLLNLFFVIVCGLDVMGVAIATAISHVISAGLILWTMIRTKSDLHLDIRHLRIDTRCLLSMLRIGVPAGVQGCCFALSNMVIQSSINSFGSYAMAGMTAGGGVEALLYSSQVAFHFTAISFVAQNMGGKHFKRVRTSMISCYVYEAAFSLILAYIFYFFGEPLLRLYDPDPHVIEWGLLRMKIMFTTYFLLGLMDAATGCLRGLGASLMAAAFTLSGACALRLVWVWFILPHYRSMECLLISYPVSWGLVALMATTAVILIYRKMVREQCARFVEWSTHGPGVPKGFRFPGGPR